MTISPLDRALAFVSAFDRRWPSEEQLRELLASNVRFIERPNLLSPRGSERDLDGTLAGVEAGRQLLAWQSYEVLGHTAEADRAVLRMRWRGELAVDAGPWPKGTELAAWSVAHYRVHDGRIVEIEQHDCYETPGS